MPRFVGMAAEAYNPARQLFVRDVDCQKSQRSNDTTEGRGAAGARAGVRRISQGRRNSRLTSRRMLRMLKFLPRPGRVQ